MDFSLKTKKITLKFKIQENKISIESIENAPSKAMNWLLGTYYTPLKLVKVTSKKKFFKYLKHNEINKAKEKMLFQTKDFLLK